MLQANPLDTIKSGGAIMISVFRNVALSLALGLAPTATTEAADHSELAAAVSEYGKAWASKNVDRIVALHTEDSEFTMYVNGTKPAVGRAAIRAQFQKILTDNPNYESTTRTIAFGPDFVVIEYSFKMQPPAPFDIGKRNFTPANKIAYDVDAIDIIYFKNSLVSVKRTYIDTEAIHNHSKRVRGTRRLASLTETT
jgi:hypothetical protein